MRDVEAGKYCCIRLVVHRLFVGQLEFEPFRKGITDDGDMDHVVRAHGHRTHHMCLHPELDDGNMMENQCYIFIY